MKRRLSSIEHRFLQRELSHLEEVGKLPQGKATELIDYYEIYPKVNEKTNVNFIQLLLMIGSVLIGLSILSFVASNWSELGRVEKYLILFFSLIACYAGGKYSEKRKPSLSKVLYYIGAFAFGGEIIYIGQLFHLGGNWEDAFLMWGLGVLPLAFYMNDRFLKLASLLAFYFYVEAKFVIADDTLAYLSIIIIPLMFVLTHLLFKEYKKLTLILNFLLLYQFIQLQFAFKPIEQESFPYIFALLLPGLFYVGHRWMDQSKPLFLINLLMSLQLIGMLFNYFHFESIVLILGTYFIIGITMVYYQYATYKKEMKYVGMLLHFVTALILSFDDAWLNDTLLKISADYAWMFALIFSIGYLIYALTMIRKENLFGVVIVCVFIFRFYVDLSLAFMNKSIAFLLGGILLIALGYWFENTRKKEAKKRAAKNNEE